MEHYKQFIDHKSQFAGGGGFKPVFMPDYLFDFQKYCVEWNLLNARSGLFQDCGMGKSIQGLVWAENIVRQTNKRILILTPLAVSRQTVAEGEKFGIECHRSINGELKGKIIVTNYEKLHLFNQNDFVGVVGDESSRIKAFKGVIKKALTEFMKKMAFRLLATATAAPNDFIELGTTSEALGHLGYMDMLNRFFKNDKNNSSSGRYYGKKMEWRFKGHAEIPFWRWVASWARAMRKPSDLGFEDNGFVLPPLTQRKHMIDIDTPLDGFLFNLPAVGLQEQRKERQHTLKVRCEKVAELAAANHKQSLIWCHLNDEGDYLEQVVKDSVQISGQDADESKEEKFLAFINGDIKKLITKLKIGGWGLNMQNCSHVIYMPDHSWEGFYQGVRRCWRFGQKNEVVVDIPTTHGEKFILDNLERKAAQADKMFTSLVDEMCNATSVRRDAEFTQKQEIPSWL